MSVPPEQLVIRCPRCKRRYRAARAVLAGGVKCRGPQCELLLTQQNAIEHKVLNGAASADPVYVPGSEPQVSTPPCEEDERANSRNEVAKHRKRIARIVALTSVAVILVTSVIISLLYLRMKFATAQIEAAEAAREEAQAEFEEFVGSRLPELIDEHLARVTQQAVDAMNLTLQQEIERTGETARLAIAHQLEDEVTRRLAEAEDRLRRDLSSTPSIPGASEDIDVGSQPAAPEQSKNEAPAPTPPKVARPKSPQEVTNLTGRWSQVTRPDQHGQRTMTVRKNGSGTLTVSLSGFEAIYVGTQRINAQLQWTMDGELVSIRLKKVEPPGLLSLIQREIEGTFRISSISKDRMQMTDTRTGESFEWKRN